jgi:hypothetical protein
MTDPTKKPEHSSEDDEPVDFDMDFEEALERVSGTDPDEVDVIEQASIPVETIEGLLDRFEEAGHDNGDGDKCWFARDLQALLGYNKWDVFDAVIKRAIHACVNSGHDPKNHFYEVFPESRKNPQGGRPSKDFELSRYACYLIAQNASSRKRQVAFAQTYFAIQTRRQELADQNGVDFSTLSETEQRLYLRDQVVEENKKLARAASGAGVKVGVEYAVFQNKGYEGLYGGKGVKEIRRHKGLKKNAKILDRMGSTELAANLFRITQTEEKLRKEQIQGASAASNAHYVVGKRVRQAITDLGGVVPEDLPVEEDVKKLARAEKKRKKLVAQSAPIPAIETPETEPDPINLKKELWKYALLVIVQQPNMEMTTKDLIAELPNYITVPDEASAANMSRKDSKFSQLVRNLKSHKTSKTNFIYQGYAEDIRGGFRATQKGREFVQSYFLQSALR